MAEASWALDSWSNFYVILGGAAGGLTGLTFVVIALVADAHAVRLTGLRAFVTPTIVHFSSVLGIAALMNIPHQTRSSLGLCLGASGLIGVCYSAGTILQLHRNRISYAPVIADWIWNAILPTVCYLALLLAGVWMHSYGAAALYAVAAVSMLLLLIGIHNAWDIAVWFTAERPAAPGEGSKPPVPTEPPAR